LNDKVPRYQAIL